MKTLILTAALSLTFTSFAEASWYQSFCSDAEATTRTADGHNYNFNEFTVRNWNDGNQMDEKLRFDGLDIRENLVSEKKLTEETKQHCGKEGEFGWSESTETTLKEVTFTKEDGSLFPLGTIGASKDLKSVTTVLYCKTEMNSEMYCGKPKSN